MTYHLSIVRTAKGDYQIQHYHKVEPEKLPDFASAIDYIISLHQRGSMSLSSWKEELTLVDLPETEKTAINSIRRVLIKQSELELKVGLPADDIPF